MRHLPSLGPRGEGWVVLQVLLLAAVAMAGFAGRSSAGETNVPMTLLGVAFLAAGVVLAVRGIVDLREALTPLPRPSADSRLVESGAYAHVRHPIYGGLVLLATGYALVLGSLAGTVCAAALFAFFRLKSEREEAWLRDRFPGYRAYAARTRRMLPWVY
jgi:protein-S-isoprenylcysteine O-methyltransferase Ste14